MTEAPHKILDFVDDGGVTVATVCESEIVSCEDVAQFSCHLGQLADRSDSLRLIVDFSNVNVIVSAVLHRVVS